MAQISLLVAIWAVNQQMKYPTGMRVEYVGAHYTTLSYNYIPEYDTPKLFLCSFMWLFWEIVNTGIALKNYPIVKKKILQVKKNQY